MKTAYLTGYTGKPTRNPAQLKQLAVNLGADGESCHRKQVGEYLAAHGWTVREVTQAEWGAAR